MMLLTFIISSQGKLEKLKKTFASFKAQTNQDFNVIVTLDPSNDVLSDRKDIEKLFDENENATLSFNTKVAGTSEGWNNGISLSEGDYISFVKEGDELLETYVDSFQACVDKNHGEVDIYEFTMKITGLVESESLSYLQKDRVYNLLTEYDPYAFVNSWIYNKIFKRAIITAARIQFRRFVRFDALFLFKVLVSSEKYMYINKTLVVHILRVIKYSAFDLVNQWPHILNYYRRVGKYKELQDYLTYAHYKDLVHNFLWLIDKFDNKVLTKKAVEFVEKKVDSKMEKFKKNKVFVNSPDLRFKEIITDLDEYFKTITKIYK